LHQIRALVFCFNAFSLREPVSTSLENAIDPGADAPGRIEGPKKFSACHIVTGAFSRFAVDGGSQPCPEPL